MTLGDGRRLAYTDLGAGGGPVVVYFHGAPTSRLDLVALDDAFGEVGVRVVSPDRPGYGGSSPQPGRGFADWPADVAELADHLRADRFAVMGLSSGGPYSVACASLLADRVAAAGVVAGVTDMAWAGAWDGYDETEVTIMRLGDEAEATTWCEEHFGTDGSRFFGTVGDMAPPDLELLADETLANGFFATVAEAFRQGIAGYAQDITVQGRPWPFDPKAITAPTFVLHGDADTFVPVTHGQHTAELIPRSTLRLIPDHGHLSIIREIPQLAAILAEHLG